MFNFKTEQSKNDSLFFFPYTLVWESMSALIWTDERVCVVWCVHFSLLTVFRKCALTVYCSTLREAKQTSSAETYITVDYTAIIIVKILCSGGY